MRFSYGPSRLEISAGESVTWTNLDLAPHTATAATFDTGRLAQGESTTFVFDAPGDFPYNCLYHANMAGRVVVRS